MNISRFSVQTTQSDVTISYDNQPVLHWTQEEWEEDPTVTISIINAVIQAYAEPEKLYEFCRKKKLINNDNWTKLNETKTMPTMRKQ